MTGHQTATISTYIFTFRAAFLIPSFAIVRPLTNMYSKNAEAHKLTESGRDRCTGDSKMQSENEKRIKKNV